MKSTNTFGIRFFLKTSAMSGLEAPIYVRITVGGVRVELSLKQKINVTEWNPVQGKAKGTKDGAKGLNHFLRELEAKIVQIYQEFQIKKKNITADAIKHELLGTYTKDHTLSMLFEFHHEHYRKILAYGTLKNYFTTEKYVLNFVKTQYGTHRRKAMKYPIPFYKKQLGLTPQLSSSNPTGVHCLIRQDTNAMT